MDSIIHANPYSKEQLYFGNIRFSFSLSRDWRRFSGKGATLESLIDGISVDSLTKRLAAMRLLEFDLDENQFFYHRLPFKLSSIIGLNPRPKNAERLIENGKVEIISNAG